MRIYCPGMLISSFSIMKDHKFQSANEHKGIEVRPASGDMVANQHQEICVKPISGQLRQWHHGEEAGRDVFSFSGWFMC